MRFLVPILLITNCLPVTTEAADDVFPLWEASQPMLKAVDTPMLANVRFSQIKQREPEVDGFTWLHGMAIVRHRGTLFTSWGHNKGKENTVTEIAQGRRSSDDGRTWGPVELISDGGDKQAVSHGTFLSHDGVLWAFCGRFTGVRQNTGMEAFVLNEKTNAWESRGVVAGEGFWPMEEPEKMDDGNWIMAGLQVGPGHPAAVAISHGDDFTHWDVIAIPQPKGINMWGESAVIVNGAEVLNIARYGGKAVALASLSKDYGRSWSEMQESNLPMATSKPYAGILSTGQRYLIGNTTAECGNTRDPLTIAVSRPGEKLFSKVWIIRRGQQEGFADPKGTKLCYPYAAEYDGNLYVVYSVGHLPANQNSGELAVIPLSELAW
ncbi:MAG: exo-alpha-sialidase [Verrucomicrobiae bacterium]|nr:exo-alpha-sialidase [Verrucomicrobiae bacterium]